MQPWVRDYKTRNWKTYEIQVDRHDERPPIKPVELHELSNCHSDSPEAQEQPGHARFYYDLEWIAADIDCGTFGGTLGRLAQDWNSHKAGVLVMSLYNGFDKDPPTWTWAIEVT